MKKILVIISLIILILSLSASGESQPRGSNEEAVALTQKALELSNAGRYEEAMPYAKKALEIAEEVLGKDHLEVAAVLNYLAELYRMTGRYAEAEPLHKRALEIRERSLGKDHLDVGTSLNNLALVYQGMGKYTDAEPLHKKSLEIYEQSLGEDNPGVATILDNLAQLYYRAGRYAEAEPLYKRSLEVRNKVFGKDHPNVATSLNNLALLYQNTGRYAEAEPLYKKALEINEKALGKDNPAVAINLDSLAQLYQLTGRYAEAEPLYKRALEIKERALGKEHPDVAISLNNLALLYQYTGRYAEAEPLYKKALEINEKALGRDHASVATPLDNLAQLYQLTGRYAEAEPLYKRSLEIRERALGKEHPDVMVGLNNLALLYEATGRYAEAEPLLRRSLEVWERVLGKDHPYVAISLNNLAHLYYNTRRYGEGELFIKRSLEIMERVLGRDHPGVATGLTNLAEFYHRSGKYAEAEPIYNRSLKIMEKTLGGEHPSVEIALTNLGLLYAITERQLESHRIFTRANGIEEKKKENVFLLFSEKEKLSYVEERKRIIHVFINHTSQYLQTDSTAVQDTLNAWLRWKGSLMEAQGRYIDALTYSDNPEVKQKFEELIHIRREIAKLELSNPEKMSFEDYQKRIQELEKKKESLEVELNRLSKDFALEKMVGKADAKMISSTLFKKGKDSVYIDFANINMYDFKENKFGKSRYLAFVLLPSAEPVVKLIDLSDTEAIDSHIRVYLEEMKRAKAYGELPRERILKAEARSLYELLLRPIEKEIKGKKHLYISPDGNLNLVPFEVLMSPDGKYLMEDYNITYIAAGRDIVRFTDTNVAKGDPVIMADPDYDMGLEEKTQVAKALGVIETRGPAPLSRNAKDLRFKRLPDTKQEANAIEKVLRQNNKTKVMNYQDKKALEEVLMTAKEPRILHLSTHGYFLKDEELKKEPQMMGFISPERDYFVDTGIENPMLRSGIALAGANASLKEGRDDGVVSAEKILGLRLKGTDLVVLSACDTGTGEVKSGEGVFGLKRSFILSGAKTVVMTLWSVKSEETTELMVEFYTLMVNGKSKAEALREARLKMMEKKSNPFYWGAFVMVGNPN